MSFVRFLRWVRGTVSFRVCLLYTSDAADD